jgi:hypothetical protein
MAYKIKKETVRKNGSLNLHLAEGGGCAISVMKVKG